MPRSTNAERAAGAPGAAGFETRAWGEADRQQAGRLARKDHHTMATSLNHHVSYMSDEYRDMERRLRPTHLQLEVVTLLHEADDISSVYMAVALPGCLLGEEPWKIGQEIVHLPGYWPAKHPSADNGASDREARDAAQLFGLLYLGDQDGRVACLRVSRYAGQLLQTFDIL
jgi:hypothetical protein